VLLTTKAQWSFETSGNIFTTEHCETPKDLCHQPLFINTATRTPDLYQSVCSKAMPCIWSYTPIVCGIFSDSSVVRKIFLQARLQFIFRYVTLAVQWSIFGVRQILGWNLRFGHELPFCKCFQLIPLLEAVQSETVTAPLYQLYSLRHWLRPYISCTVWDTDCALI